MFPVLGVCCVAIYGGYCYHRAQCEEQRPQNLLRRGVNAAMGRPKPTPAQLAARRAIEDGRAAASFAGDVAEFAGDVAEGFAEAAARDVGTAAHRVGHTVAEAAEPVWNEMRHTGAARRSQAHFEAQLSIDQRDLTTAINTVKTGFTMAVREGEDEPKLFWIGSGFDALERANAGYEAYVESMKAFKQKGAMVALYKNGELYEKKAMKMKANQSWVGKKAGVQGWQELSPEGAADKIFDCASTSSTMLKKLNRTIGKKKPAHTLPEILRRIQDGEC